jgi:ATP-binding cassette subfamily C protein CydD
VSQTVEFGSILGEGVPAEGPAGVGKSVFKFDPRLRSAVSGVRGRLVQAVLGGALSAFVLVAQAWLISRIIAGVFMEGARLPEVKTDLALLGSLSLLYAGLHAWRECAAQEASTRIRSDLRLALADKLFRLGPAMTYEERTGDLGMLLQEDMDALDAYIRGYLPQLALAALIPLSILSFVLPSDPISGWILLLTAPLIPVFMILIGDAAGHMTRRQWKTLGRMSVFFLDILQGLVTLKTFGRSREQADRIREVSDAYRKQVMGVLRVAFLSALVLEMLTTLSTALVAVGIGVRLLSGGLDFEQALFILVLAPEFYLPLRMLGTKFHAGVAGVVAAERIFEHLEKTPPYSGFGEAHAVRGDADPSEIKFVDVSFGYPGRADSALRDFSLTIRRGQMVALIGHTGCGKSTVANLLLGFLEPQKGQILIDGLPLASCRLDEWRARLAWVPQHPTIFDMSIADNIRLARPDSSMQEVITAARAANAHEFISRLPDGYETCLRREGIALSGGEIGRIAIARSFLKSSPVLLLDEPTAQLDPASESTFLEALHRLLEGRTGIIISHRLPVILRADVVVVLSGGEILEVGPPPHVFREGGYYNGLAAWEGDR